jgi:ABC-type sugar transport system ATPase subunit
MMVGRDFQQFFVKEGEPGEDIVLRVKKLTRTSADPPQMPVFEDISFEVRRGEQFGIAGLLGSGRTELLEALFGAAAADTTGSVELEGVELDLSSPRKAIGAGMALITEDRKGNGLIISMNVEQNLTLAALRYLVRFSILSKTKERALAEEYVERLSIDVSDLKNPIETLSGGNQQKVLLAKWLATRPKVLLLDEPTRGIDVGAKHELYIHLSELAKQGVSIVMVSSELPELLSICDRIMVLRSGRVSALFDREEASQEKILSAAAPAA